MNKSFVKVKIVSILMVAGVLLVSTGLVLASSHRDSPLISQDPAVDATDFYAFVSPDKPDTVTFLANYIPMEEPAIGQNYHFDDNVLYSIDIDNNGDAKEDISYQFRFKTVIQSKDVVLYAPAPIKTLDDSSFHVRQTYTLTKVEHGVSTVLGSDLPVPPNNLGPHSMPDYQALSQAAVRDVGEGIKVFAGQIDDPFFAETGGLFDLLTIRRPPGNAGGGVDGLGGFNTHTLALQIPIEQLTKGKVRLTSAGDPNAVIGTWTSAYRQTTRVFAGTKESDSGNWVEVSRLGAPLVNDFFIPYAKKDYWNTTIPLDDAQFADYIADPLVTKTLQKLYGLKIPPQGPYGSPKARADLVAIFLTGIPGLTQPANVVPAEELRLNTAIPPTAQPNRLTVFAGDMQGFPNGRRLTDDVVDIALRGAAGAAYPLLADKSYKPDPAASVLGDGIDTNDKPFRNTFPYAALPWSGYESIPHANAYIQPSANINSKEAGAPTDHRLVSVLVSLVVILSAVCGAMLLRNKLQS